MSTIKQHLGLLQQLKRYGQDAQFKEQANIFVDAHLGELIALAGGVELEDFAKKHLESLKVSRDDPSCMGAFQRAKP
jgi:hypothetical protein